MSAIGDLGREGDSKMKLKLTVEVPGSMPEDEALRHLILARAERFGLTLVTGKLHCIDVDLIDVERGA